MVSHITASMHQKLLLWPELLGIVSRVLSIFPIVNTDTVLGKFQLYLKCSMCIKSFNLYNYLGNWYHHYGIFINDKKIESLEKFRLLAQG